MWATRYTDILSPAPTRYNLILAGSGVCVLTSRVQIQSWRGDGRNTVAVADQCDHVPVRLHRTLENHERLHMKVARYELESVFWEVMI